MSDITVEKLRSYAELAAFDEVAVILDSLTDAEKVRVIRMTAAWHGIHPSRLCTRPKRQD